ncbi:hypothetical protein QAD02_017250 [Eretmocerus hayati]|uniref:Uncharacterized protein n=1 Tax=Eretmocerus hayati TaxID=131215 RepID=A0ACC2PEG5_9HYME|nr:hypothetical protein QAD02_017250 [Eretmocerus hayati]
MYHDELVFSCKKLDQAIVKLNKISTPPAPTYANITRQLVEPSHKVSLVEGKSFRIKSKKQIVIGPTDANKDKFPTSSETRRALMAAANPAALKLNAQRVTNGPHGSVV